MADSSGVDLQERLRLLNVTYAAQLPEKIQQIETAWHALQNVWDKEKIHALHRLVHSLTGSGATFGFAELSSKARILEQTLKGLDDQNVAPDEEQCAAVLNQIGDLRGAAFNQPVMPARAAPKAHAPSNYQIRDSKWIFIVDDNAEVAQELVLQLEGFGYQIAVFNRMDQFKDAIKQIPYAIVLMDIEFSEGHLKGCEAIVEIQKTRDTPMQILFMSSYTSLSERLAAVRAGGSGYFAKPVNIGNLIDKLDELDSRQSQQPFRILIVDDEDSVSAHHAAVLERAGIEVRTVNHPMRAIEALSEFEPDLILMDIYMPECSGPELAKVIRQMSSCISIPIVFLSSEIDLDKQFIAKGEGGDDFLIKPIQPEHLVSAITSRIQRFRLLRSFMIRDSLTGLLNHTAIKEQLDREVARVRRSKSPLSLAMVDIDHFKKINDTYGHLAGDRVIKSLSRLLKQRLRNSDFIGRYGGEEFAVILSDTTGEAAVKVLDEIRVAFSKLRQLGEGEEFFVTFSCGIAEITATEEDEKLGGRADRALYQAKNAGRNCVMLARQAEL